MGRFVHEAVAVDPASGIVYQTQDDLNRSALYRYVPDDDSGRPGSLARGGRLQAARVKGVDNASLLAPALGEEHDVGWVDIADPDADPGDGSLPDAPGPAAGPFLQAWAAGALRMSRGEGIWYFGGKLFVVDTSAGVDGEGRPGFGTGAVWELDLATMRMRAIFVSSDPLAGNHPDNVTVSPRGGILLCEDGGGVEDDFGFGNRLMGLLPSGETFVLAKNDITLGQADLAAAGKAVEPGDYRGAEFCGACFDPAGEVLFVNVQTPGITVAIRGPWARGTL